MNCIITPADQTEASNGGVQLANHSQLEMRRMAAGGRTTPNLGVTHAIQSILLMPKKTQPSEPNSTLGAGTDCPIPAELAQGVPRSWGVPLTTAGGYTFADVQRAVGYAVGPAWFGLV